MTGPAPAGGGNSPFRRDLYTDEAGGVSLLAGRCTVCGALAFPRRTVCAACGSEAIAGASLAAEGIVYASTIVRVPSFLAIPAPYGCGHVDLDAGVRVFAWFGTGDVPVPPGTRVRASVAPLRAGLDAPCFRPLAMPA